MSPFICINAGEKIVFTFTYYSWPIPVKDAIADWVDYGEYDPNNVFGTLHLALQRMTSIDELAKDEDWSPSLKNTVSYLSAGVWSFDTFKQGHFVFGSFNRKLDALSPERFIVQVDVPGTGCRSIVSTAGSNSRHEH